MIELSKYLKQCAETSTLFNDCLKSSRINARRNTLSNPLYSHIHVRTCQNSYEAIVSPSTMQLYMGRRNNELEAHFVSGEQTIPNTFIKARVAVPKIVLLQIPIIKRRAKSV